MLLSCRILENVGGVNDFDTVEAATFTEGDNPSIYLQLVDKSLDKAIHGFTPPGRRYMPDAGATLQVILDHVDDARKLTKAATQPYSQDPSIWRIDLSASDVVRGTVSLRLRLTEGSRVTSGSLLSGILVEKAES